MSSNKHIDIANNNDYGLKKSPKSLAKNSGGKSKSRLIEKTSKSLQRLIKKTKNILLLTLKGVVRKRQSTKQLYKCIRKKKTPDLIRVTEKKTKRWKN